jgi:hypothetical protein
VLKGPQLTIHQPRTHRTRNATIVDRRVIPLIQAPNPRSRPPLTLEATLAPPPTRNGTSTLTQAEQNYARRRVNQVAMEEAQKDTTMVPGTSLINSILS